MEWKFISYESPKKSGNYVVSIRTTYIFKYVAYYDFNSKRWYKYDPFSKDEHGEEIDGNSIIGWIDNFEIAVS